MEIEKWLDSKTERQKATNHDVWVLGGNGLVSFLVIKRNDVFIFNASGLNLTKVTSVEQIKKLCELMGMELKEPEIV